MLTSVLFIALPLSILVLLIVRLARRRSRRPGLVLWELGAIMDDALRAFRADVVPLLAASIVLLPIGGSAGVQLPFVARVLGIASFRAEGAWRNLMVLGMVGAFGVGQTLLGCAVARAHQRRLMGHDVTLRGMLLHERWRAVLGLAVLLAIPSAVATLLGLLGALFALHWALAPALLILENCSPAMAIKRSFRLVRQHYSGLLNLLVLLWCIAWLLAATPLGIGYLLMASLDTLPSWANEMLLPLLFVAGTALVAPLTALGCVHFLLYVQADAFSRHDGATAPFTAARPMA